MPLKRRLQLRPWRMKARWVRVFVAIVVALGVNAIIPKKKKKKSILAPPPGKINRPFYSETAPSITADGKTLFYLVQNPNKDGAREREDFDIFVSTLGADGWSGGRPVRALNTSYYEGYPSISADGRLLFFSSDAHTAPAGADSIERDSDLYFSNYNKGKWSKPVNMGEEINVEGLAEIGGSISPNGQIFVFFAENRSDSLGKTDIYISYKNEDGSWRHAQNIGKTVNSKYREFAPYVAADSRTLYFSSDRKGGYGGLDLYKTVLKRKKWSKPKNLGKKVNTKENDLGITIPAKGDVFFTSQINDEGDFDIMTGILPPGARPYKVILVKGVVRDKKSKAFVQSEILVEDLDTGKPIGLYKASSDDGSFTVSLMEGTRYSFSATAKDYFIFSETHNFKKIGKYREEIMKIDLVPIKKGEVAIAKNIFFRPGLAKLDKKSRLVLNKIFRLMRNNNVIRFEIRGHTDDVGPDKGNLKLSQARANGVVKYLIKKGIDKSRLVAKGFGEKKPVVPNNSKANRAKNRRIEFVVLDK